MSFDSDGRIKEYKPPELKRMTAKGGNSDIDLNGSLNKDFFRERGLTLNFDGDRPGASMFNEGDTLSKTKGGKKISTTATALDFSAGKNNVVDKKDLNKFKSNTPSMDQMMGTLTGSSKPSYKKMGRSTLERGKGLLTSRHAKFSKTKNKNKDKKTQNNALKIAKRNNKNKLGNKQ